MQEPQENGEPSLQIKHFKGYVFFLCDSHITKQPSNKLTNNMKRHNSLSLIPPSYYKLDLSCIE